MQLLCMRVYTKITRVLRVDANTLCAFHYHTRAILQLLHIYMLTQIT